MGTTPIYGFRYQELGDPPDGAGLGQHLAEDVEAEVNSLDARVESLETFPSCSVSLVGAGPTTDGTTVAIAFDNVISNDLSMYSAAAPSVITIQLAGVYLVQGLAAWKTNAAGRRTAELFLTPAVGTARGIAMTQVAPADGGATTVPVMCVTRLEVGDQLELHEAAPGITGTLECQGGAESTNPRLSATMIAD